VLVADSFFETIQFWINSRLEQFLPSISDSLSRLSNSSVNCPTLFEFVQALLVGIQLLFVVGAEIN